MSANVHPSRLAVAPPAAAVKPARAAVAADSEPMPEETPANTPAPSPPAAALRPTSARWRTSAAGYCLTTLGVCPVFIIPSLKSYWMEDALIFFSIASLLAGAALVTWSFLRDLFKRT